MTNLALPPFTTTLLINSQQVCESRVFQDGGDHARPPAGERLDDTAQDAYFAIPIHKHYQKCFYSDGRNKVSSQYDAAPCVTLPFLLTLIATQYNTKIDSDSILVFLHLVAKRSLQIGYFEA